MSSEGSNKKHLIHFKSSDREIMIGVDTEVIAEHSLFRRIHTYKVCDRSISDVRKRCLSI